MHDAADAEMMPGLSGFRAGFYECLTTWADALFELAEAAICTDGPVTSLVELSLAPEHVRRACSVWTRLGPEAEARAEPARAS